MAQSPLHAEPDHPGATAPAGPSFAPLYQQIKVLIVRSLQAGEWGPGDALPSEIELAARFKVSQGTGRKAIDELTAERLVVRRQGKGTFVATHAEAQTQYRFLRLEADDGVDAPVMRRFIACRSLPAPADVARGLGLREGEAVICVRRVLDFKSRPVVLDDIWLPESRFAGLTADKLSGWRGPMYALFESEFGVHMVGAEEKLRAVAADAESAELLQLPEGSPLLCVERVARTYGEQPVEFRRGLYNTQEHFYRNELV